MPFPDVDQVKAALDAGATYSAGKLVINGVPHYLLLQDNVWAPDPSTGVLIYNRTHFDKMKASAVISGGDYDNCFATDVGNKQLAAVFENGVTKAKLIEP